MRTARGAAARSIGQALNLSSYTSHTCPAGYHWVDTPQGPIMGVNRGHTRTVSRLAACVPNPPPPPPPPAPRTIRLSLGPPPAAAPPPAPVVASPPPPRSYTFAAPPVAMTLPTAAVASAPVKAAPTAAAAPACNCWPLWWLLVPLAAGAAAGYAFSGKGGAKKRKNAAHYVVRHVVRRVNPFAAMGI